MKVVLIFCGVVLAALVVLLVVPMRDDGDLKGKQERAYPLTKQLSEAFIAYKNEYAAYPDGGYEKMLQALQGDNPRKIVFITFSPQELDAHGVLVDPWGVSYHIELPEGNSRPRVWSSGPDRVDESAKQGSDDIVSWR